MSPNETLALLSMPGLAVMLGAIFGAWMAFRRRERARGHLWLAAIVGLAAAAAVTFHTVGGAKEELFSRVVMLPLTLLLAVAGATVLLGVPIYVGYLVGFRLASRVAGRNADREA